MRESPANHNALAPFSEVPPRLFETERLILRALTIADLDLIFQTYTGDLVATKYMAWPRYTQPEDGRLFLEAVDASFSGTPIGSAQFSWLITLKGTGESIGGCGIGTDSETTAGGGYILNPRFWGKGYATEAFAAVVAWARSQPDVQRILATHHPENPASGGVMRKVGMTFARINRKENAYPNLGQRFVEEVVYEWMRDSGESR
jgi:ribosomal-protein-alanine N-acetyltransferase